MTEEIYRKLAQRLDAIPNGFSSTESGAELRLLAKIFTPKEAALASIMRLRREQAADIATRAGMAPDAAQQILKEMAGKGLIRVREQDEQFTFGLIPFVVGIYEYQLPRMDVELAALFEEYYQETRGGAITGEIPAVHRVVPVEEAVPLDLEIFPYERATELIEGAKSWGVRDCICRVQQELVGKGCDHPVENCITFAPVAGVFDHSEVDRAITKDEALRILHETEEAGLVHSTGNYRDGRSYICNCCACSCGIMRGVTEFGIPTAMAHSDFHAVVNVEECIGCKDCVAHCQFGALSVPEDICQVDYARCLGCGLCAAVCPADALRLERRPEGETPPLPSSEREWMVWRAQERGISIKDVL
ncbi:MAG: 4Fe-4S dicluster domain-containing protein [Chloroflexi bacterium]|nr:4Fe-4S dicluster domain-containing protein [Chloroflexota bacterium]